jgi:FPC/CPF motif-containing protein YcgG
VTDLSEPVPDSEHASDEALLSSLTGMVEHPAYPCLGAKAVFHREQATVRAYDHLGSPGATRALADDLREFAHSGSVDGSFVSFVAIFRGPTITDEVHFERLLWRQLSQLARRDGSRWNGAVSADPADNHFGFSLFGVAYFVVGLHPQASRDARRAGSPVLVFNPHAQFDRLRDEGRYTRMRDVIRRRDLRLQGTINPMVRDHGTESEARQYAGRPVGSTWEPPEWIETST